MASRTCRSKRIRGCFLLGAAFIVVIGTCYLIASPDPETKSASDHIISELASESLNRHKCDDPDWGPHRLSVVIPFRDRFDELLEFAPHMRNFLCRQRIRHQLLVVSQTDPYRFNRGALLNIGFLLSERASFDYIATHDVDLLPVNPNISYSYPANGPMHVSSPELHPKYHYEKFLGGILLITNDHFKQARGFTNNFWGWGREDDEFYRRVLDAGLTIFRPEGISTGNATFRHLHDSMRRPRDAYRYGDQKASLRRDKVTGFDTVGYRVESTHNLRVDDEADVIVVNVRLHCDLSRTPWCLTPRQLASAVEAERSRLSPKEFANLQDSLRRHGLRPEPS